MHKITKTAFLAIWIGAVVSLVSASSAQAQLGGARVPRPFGRPTVSPYLNLIQGGGSNLGINYYGLVRPQQQLYQQNENLRKGLSSQSASRYLQRNPRKTNGQRYRMGVTGHVASFGQVGLPQQGGAGGGTGSLFGQDDTLGNSQFGGRSYSGHGSGYSYGNYSGGSSQFGNR